jgi:predicted nucleic acid-binding protein
VKIADALKAVNRVFLDTAPVIFFIERDPSYSALVDEIFDRIDAGTLHAVTSPVTLAECLVQPMRRGLIQAQRDFTDLIVFGANVTFQRLDDATGQRAADLRARYNLLLADAFQVAAALDGGCDALLTNDYAFRRVQELTILILDDLEL